MNVSDGELQWVVKHLGHTLNVHQTYYRVTSDVVEKAKLSKLLILADEGKVGQFVGKRLADVSYEGINYFI